MSAVLDERFWSKVDKTDSCWIWTASVRVGYGAFCVRSRMQAAHRLAYIDVLKGMQSQIDLGLGLA